MRNFLTVFKFEYSGYLKSKSYLITTFIILTVIIIVSFIPQLSNLISNGDNDSDDGKAAYILKELSDDSYLEKYINADTLKAAIPDFSWKKADVNNSPKELINSEGYSLVVVFDTDYEYKLYGSGSDLKASSYSESVGNFFTDVARGIAVSKLDNELQAEISNVFSIQANGEFIPVGGNEGDAWGNYWIAYFMVFILYMVVTMYGQFVMTSVTMEKSSRAMEILITSAKPTQLMFGKVMGVGCVALSQIILILVTLLLCININIESWEEFAPSIFEIINSTTLTAGLVISFIIFFILGYFIYAFMYAALGSTISKVEEAGNMATLPVFLLIASFIASMWGITNIESPVAIVLSYVPYFSQFMMFNRLCMGTASIFEVCLSMTILLITIILVGYLAAKIYRIGVLMYGKPMSLRNIIKAII